MAILKDIKSHWRVKLVYTIILTSIHWTTYLWIQRNPFFQVTTVSPNALDSAIPFHPGWIYMYLSINLLVPISFWIIDRRSDLIRYGASLMSMLIFAYAIFFFFPTSCTRPVLRRDVAGAYEFFTSIDCPLNAFPSLHAAMTVFSSLCCSKMFVEKNLKMMIPPLWIWALMILFSTLTTKQHVMVDLLGGALLGLAGFVLFCRLDRENSCFRVKQIQNEAGNRL